MKISTLLASAVLAAGLGLAATAQAMPVVPDALGITIETNQNPMIVEAGYRCGPGWHLGPRGHRCLPNHPMRHWHRWHRHY